MHIILGGTGQVGSATAQALLDKGEAVTVVTRDAQRADELASKGAHVAVADLRDTDRLNKIFRSGRRAFLLNPSADVLRIQIWKKARTQPLYLQP